MLSDQEVATAAESVREVTLHNLQRVLWITWVAPFPERDGQRMYSGRLIDAVARSGASVHVLCLSNEDGEGWGSAPPGNITWHTVDRGRRARWRSLFSRLPSMAYRAGGREMRRALTIMLSGRKWDAIVLDGISSGWALPVIEAVVPANRDAQGRPKLIHVSHNHETSTRRAVAKSYIGNPAMWLALRRDAEKTRRLERRVVESCDVVSAITQDDAERYRREHPERKILVLTPGYGGHRVSHRQIVQATPRNAIIVGSFEWVAKKMNLKAFLAAADRRLADAGVRLTVVGRGDRGFLTELGQNLRSVTIVGEVDDVTPYLEDARIAVVPEKTGGGFKLKLLDYVFHRVPIFAMAGSLAGSPLRSGRSAMEFATFEELADGIVRAIDDTDHLNAYQDRAFEACRAEFDWEDRGAALVRAIAG